MLIKSLVPPSNHIRKQAQNSPRLLNVNLYLLILSVSKISGFEI